MINLNKLTLAKSLKLLKNKEISLDEIYKDTELEVQKNNQELNIYLKLNKTAKKDAKSFSAKPLAGLPIAVKDNFCTRGITTTASSNVLKEFIPEYESTVTKRLQEAGGVVFGKTNMDAWAHGSSTETSDFGRTLNPRNKDFLPGGSSGGSAAAVAADMCIAAIGSETAGSIRQPASWCGVVGLKPTYGRVSRYGVVAMASSTDSPGPISKTVEDSAILFNYIAGKDSLDSTTGDFPVPDLTQALNKDVKGLKVGYIYHDLEGISEFNSELEKQLRVFENMGVKVEKADALDPKLAISVYTVVQRSEVSSNLARFDGIRYGNDRSHFGAEAKRRIMLGTYALSKGYADQYYNTAQKVRSLFIEDHQKLFEKYDLLVALSSPGYAQRVGDTEGSVMYGELADMLLEPSSITGLPGISIPCFTDQKTNLSLGMNIIAPMWQEDKMISLAHAFEQSTNWNQWKNDE